MNEDMELLTRYVTEGVEDAFTSLVHKYLDLVHSAALRQVRSPDLAGEVAQAVFTELARSADRLSPNTQLITWLYHVTRRRAIDVIRREARRQAREQTAEQLKAMNSRDESWHALEPLLEEAMDSLEPDDRTAILQRYFQNKSLRDVGKALGASENAAQKRLSRAIERLHSFFARKGVTVSSACLASTISAHGVEAAPLELAMTIAQNALHADALIQVGTGAAAIKTLTMTTAQKVLFTMIVISAVGTAVYKARQSSQLRGQIQQMQNSANAGLLAESVRQLTEERDLALNRVATLERENQRFERNGSELLRLRDETTRLRAEAQTRLNEARLTQSIAQDTNSLQHILTVLSDRDREKTTDTMRYHAAEKLRSIGPEALDALPEFIGLLHSETEATRYSGARALAFLSERSPEAFQQLTNALVDPNAQVRDAASHGVGLLFNQNFKNVDVVATLPTVLQNLEDSSRTVRADSIQALRQFIDAQHWSGKDAQPDLLIPRLIARLSDDYSYARRNAVMALRSYGQKAQAAVPHLEQLANDPDEQVRRLSEAALVAIEKVPNTQTVLGVTP